MEGKQSIEEILDRLERKAGDYLEAYGSCAQGTLRALQEEFGLGNAEVLKAATAMPGVALRGETCGAVIGPIMALGLAFGREKPEEHEAFLRTLQAAHRFCRRFEEEFGSCMCAGVQEHLFGRYFDLTDPAQMQEFAAAEASKKCRIPAGKAVRIAGRMILGSRNPSDDE
ncbi:MAG: C-GCAxxG-C-C family protein [Actinomycetota bacterium]|nr:C-GCAxxG-C-C family protein [Actinomycetota bacterium]